MRVRIVQLEGTFKDDEVQWPDHFRANQELKHMPSMPRSRAMHHPLLPLLSKMQRAVRSPLCAQPLITGCAFLPCYQLCYPPLDVFKDLSILFTLWIAALHAILKVRLHLMHCIFLWTGLNILISKHYNNGNKCILALFSPKCGILYTLQNAWHLNKTFFFFPEKSFSAVWNTEWVSIYLLTCQYVILGMEWAMKSKNKQHTYQCSLKKCKIDFKKINLNSWKSCRKALTHTFFLL